MRIAIIGHGRMGKLVEETALRRGHEISCVIDCDNESLLESEAFKGSDVAIEFSQPQAAEGNIRACFAAGVPVVSGTTGWQSELPVIKEMCEKGEGTLLYSTNFSIGMNIFMAVSRELARMMFKTGEYRPSLSETHHIHKLDHPSGTAITLAEDLIGNFPSLRGWAEPEEGKIPEADILQVSHERRGEVAGIHTITWDSPFDTIEITHSAKSREGFALGAVKAAEWLVGKNGFFTMEDVMKSEFLTDTCTQ